MRNGLLWSLALRKLHVQAIDVIEAFRKICAKLAGVQRDQTLVAPHMPVTINDRVFF